MGTYFNPPDEVKMMGRPLEGGTHTEYVKLAAQLEDGEIVVGLFDRLIFKNAPVFEAAYDPQAELEEFQKQVQSGALLFEGYYAVPRDASAAAMHIPVYWSDMQPKGEPSD